MLHICNDHISMNIESLFMIFGGVIAHGVEYRISYINVVTSKMRSLRMTQTCHGNTSTS